MRGGEAIAVWEPAWGLRSRCLHGLSLCHSLTHRSTCPPGFRTLTSTAGPRIRRTSCCDCSGRRSTWLLRGGLCPPFRWCPCDRLGLGAWGPVLTSIPLAEAVFSPSQRDPLTPENLVLRRPHLSLKRGRGCSGFPAPEACCMFP